MRASLSAAYNCACNGSHSYSNMQKSKGYLQGVRDDQSYASVAVMSSTRNRDDNGFGHETNPVPCIKYRLFILLILPSG